MARRVDWKRRALNAERREAAARAREPIRAERWKARAYLAEKQLVRCGPARVLSRTPGKPELMREVMRRIKACNGTTGADGFCDCARYIGELVMCAGSEARREAVLVLAGGAGG